jgi:hypothetical protein
MLQRSRLVFSKNILKMTNLLDKILEIESTVADAHASLEEANAGAYKTIVSSPHNFDLVASYKGSFAYTINTYLRTIAAKQQLSEELKSEASECIALDKLLQLLMHMQGYPTRGIVYRDAFSTTTP